MCDGTFLLVQWLKLHAANPWGSGCSLGQGIRSHMPQLKKVPAATKTLYNQIFI